MSEIWSKINIGFYVKYPSFLSDWSETWIFSTDFRKIHIKFDGNPSCGRPVVPCGRTETDMTRLVVAFRKFVDDPSNVSNKSCKFQYVAYVRHVPIWTQCVHFEGKGTEKFNPNLNYKSQWGLQFHAWRHSLQIQIRPHSSSNSLKAYTVELNVYQHLL
jgi:hypothetical protein